MSRGDGKIRPAVFLDRDGTIIEDRGNLSHPSQVVFFAETIPSLQKLRNHYALFMVTHQPGVATGAMTMQDVERVNAHVVSHLAEAGVQIKATFVCPHQRSDDCRCIKPKPYFLLKAREEHGIDLRRSFVIGDHPQDVEMATNAGAQGIYVLSGHGKKHLDQIVQGTRVVSGIQEAADWILPQSDNCAAKMNQPVTTTRGSTSVR